MNISAATTLIPSIVALASHALMHSRSTSSLTYAGLMLLSASVSLGVLAIAANNGFQNYDGVSSLPTSSVSRKPFTRW